MSLMNTCCNLLSIVLLFQMALFTAPAQAAADVEDGLALLGRMEAAFVAVADKVMPAVVSIDVQQTRSLFPERGGSSGPDSVPRNELYRFFGIPQEYRQLERRVMGTGSGFIVYSDGYILTNYHVIENADSITVQTVDGTEYEATIHGPDPKSDLALIKIDATDLPTVVLGDSDAMKVGQFVMAIGNPSGFDHTMNVGHVSALGRFNISPTNRDFSQENFIQTDAAIGLGMSGGPLVNISGEVVGISTLMAPFAQSLGFAVPINMAKEVLDELKEKGRVVRGYLGVRAKALDYGVGSQYGLENDNGALVMEVMPGSPADEVGLLAYDIILEVSGKAVDNANELVRTVSRMKPGDEMALVVVRDKKELRLTVALVEQPTVAEQEPAGAGRSPLDLVCRNLNDEEIERLGVKTGVIVTEVKADGVASKGGIQSGDVILEVNRRPITNALQFYQALDDMETEGYLILMIHRDGRRLIRHLRIPENE